MKASVHARLAAVGYLVLLTLTSPLWLRTARAETVEAISVPAPAAARRPVDAFVGAVTGSTPVELPAFHGLAPDLALSYRSSLANGWVGTGMTISGLSSIERRSAGLGAPRGDATDVFVLDGERLLPCATNPTAASCMAGGTHVRRHDDGSRITLSGAVWIVTSPKGVASTYSAVTPQVAAIASRKDPFGNLVSFTYTVSGAAYYPASIAYNGTLVTFGWQARPDTVTEGTGPALRTISSRLAAITVATDGVTVRSYQLSYATTTASGASQLVSIRELGSDGATAMPATRFAHTPEPARNAFFIGATGTFTSAPPPVGSNKQTLVGDVNGDGRSDAIAVATFGAVPGTFEVLVRLATPSATFSAPVKSTVETDFGGAYDHVETGDVDGDGRTDLVFLRRSSVGSVVVGGGGGVTGFTEARLALGRADGTFAFKPVVRISNEPFSAQYEHAFIVDVDHDGRAELVLGRVEPLPSGVRGEVSILLSRWTGSNLGVASKKVVANLNDGTGWATVSLMAGDVDGDRFTDLVVVRRHSSLCGYFGEADGAESFAIRGRGDGTFMPPIRSFLHGSGGGIGSASCDDHFLGETLADVNGDGIADLVGDSAYSIYGAVCTDCDGDVEIAVNLGRGDGQFGPIQKSLGWSGSGVWIGKYPATFADVNGDGMADRVGVRVVSGRPLVQVNLSRGDGTFHQTGNPYPVTLPDAPSWWGGDGNALLMADVDGDGRAEPLLSDVGASNWLLADVRPNNPFGALLQSVTLPSGSRLTYTFGSSAVTASPSLPFVVPIVTATTEDDGRGTIGTTSFAYTGGLYSPAERRFLGFRTVRIVDPTGAYREQVYTQHVADADGTQESEHARAANGALLRYTVTQFARTGNGSSTAYTSRPSDRYEYDCSGDASCKAKRTGWTYSAYGAVASEIEHGDIAVTGDERTTFRTQSVNPTVFLTNLDSEVSVRAGAGVVTGDLLSQTRTTYDGAASHTAPPSRGAPTATSRWVSGAKLVTTTATFDGAGNRLTETTPLGATTTTTTYDIRHRPTNVTNALGHTSSSAYDTIGRLVRTIDANGLSTELAYDPLSRLVRRSTPDGGIATARFVNWGTPSTQYVETAVADGSAEGLWRRSYVDGLGRTYRTVDKGGITRDTQYDARGLVAKTSAPYLTGATPAWTVHTYDPIGREIRVQTPDAAKVDTTYGDWEVTIANEVGRRVERRYDAYGQLVRVVETHAALPLTTTIARDLLGRVVGTTDSAGNLTGYAYDGLGRRQTTIDPDLGLWTFVFDDDGRIVRRTDARGVVIDTTYDGLGRPLARTSGLATLATFTYDRVAASCANVGHLTNFTDPSGSTHRNYDAMGRLQSERKEILGTTYELDWAYDQAGRLASTTYPAVAGTRETVTTTYDTNGRVTAVGGYVAGAAYDARGALTAATYGNGNRVARTFSPARGWLMAQQITSSARAVLDDLAVTRDAHGSILTKSSSVDPDDTWTYGYDDLGRLVTADNASTPAHDESYAYDALGSPLTITRGGTPTTLSYPLPGTPRPHAPAAIGASAVRYDANGNRLGVGGAPNATFDAENRMTSDGSTTYRYDAEGTRVSAGTTVLVRNLFQRAGASSLRFYFLGEERIARRDQSGGVDYYHADQLGSVRRLTAANGATSARKLLSPFGRVLSSTGVADPFALAGQRLDPSGLYHMGARYMDPAIGQFTSPDPSDAPDAANPQTLNRYTYANNAPVQWKDPTGFQSEEEDSKKKEKENAEKRKERLAEESRKAQWINVEHETADGRDIKVRRPRLYSPEFYAHDAKRKPGDDGQEWAYKSTTGYVYSDLNETVSKPGDEAPLGVRVISDLWSRESIITSVTQLRKQGMTGPTFIEDVNTGVLERIDGIGKITRVTDPSSIVRHQGELWLYMDDPLAF